MIGLGIGVKYQVRETNTNGETMLHFFEQAIVRHLFPLLCWSQFIEFWPCGESIANWFPFYILSLKIFMHISEGCHPARQVSCLGQCQVSQRWGFSDRPPRLWAQRAISAHLQVAMLLNIQCLISRFVHFLVMFSHQSGFQSDWDHFRPRQALVPKPRIGVPWTRFFWRADSRPGIRVELQARWRYDPVQQVWLDWLPFRRRSWFGWWKGRWVILVHDIFCAVWFLVWIKI